MRILVISDLPQFVTGGAEIQASRLIEAWLDRGHEVLCFGRRMHGSVVQIGRHRLQVRRIRVFQRLGRPGRAITYFLSLGLLLLRYRLWPDVIYTRFLHEAAATAALLKHVGSLRCALVPTPANAGVNGDDKVIAALPFRRFLVRVMDAQCDAINLIAPAMRGDLRDLGFSDAKFHFIPNGINIPAEVPRNHNGPLRLLFIGRLASQKGIDILLHALGRLALGGEPTPYQLKIVGDGPERVPLETLASTLGLATNVSFVGEMTGDQVQAVLSDSDVFLLPSRYEGMSNAGLEAMARGLPLLLTRCGGLDTYLDESCGWVAPPEDEDALVEQLRQILETPRARLLQMGAGAREVAQRHFAMSEVADRYLKLFATIRHPRHGAGPQ